jgi:acetyltransferase-like isoleucine patch superfamily enzyme
MIDPVTHSANGAAPASFSRDEMSGVPAGHQMRGTRSHLFRLVKSPALYWYLLNAQIRLRWRTKVPLSVRLVGRACIEGGGKVVLGDAVVIRGTRVPVELIAHPGGRIEVGAGTFLNYGVSVSAHESVIIGRDCHIGHYSFIYDNDLHDIVDKRKLPPSGPVVLEDRVWLGTRVQVLKGVRIGHDSVIGAGSVVTRDIPPRCIAAGMPAKVIRHF